MGTLVISTASVAAPARRARRFPKPASQQRARLTPSESRLLSLRESPAQRATTTLAERRRPRRFALSRRDLADAAFWLAVLIVFGGGAYFIDRGGHQPVLVSDVSNAFKASAEGSGRIVLPVPAPGSLALRVGIDAVPGETDYWFWCFESSAGLAAEDHFCRNTGLRDESTGYTVSEGIARIAAPSASGAAFFVQLYCPNRCHWWVEATPAPASAGSR